MTRAYQSSPRSELISLIVFNILLEYNLKREKKRRYLEIPILCDTSERQIASEEDLGRKRALRLR